ncbi:MAG: LytTR family DNA-binding domain-containing protein [Pseudomonadota bacterium]|jgi:hypothetical protein|nr:LytTR family DNA-binding domain-containing protein [Pseudomonadota bacterium]
MTQTQTDPARRAEHDAERRALTRATVFSLCVLLVFLVVDALSIATEMRWSGHAPGSLPWVQEGTAIFAIMIALPVALWTGHRFPVERGRLARALPAHLAGLLVYAAVQIGLMFTIREAIWPMLYARPYTVDGSWADVFVYEFRKQAVAYIGFQAILAADMALERARMEARAARTEAQTRHRITLKTGGRVRLLEAEGFVSAKAAGNYVEAHFGEREHLARMTLTELERLLAEAGVDAVRVHRSWLVNRTSIAEIVPTGEGDVTLVLGNGMRIPGSRRYRDRLETA